MGREAHVVLHHGPSNHLVLALHDRSGAEVELAAAGHGPWQVDQKAISKVWWSHAVTPSKLWVSGPLWRFWGRSGRLCEKELEEDRKRSKLGEWNNFWRLICLSQQGELWRDSSQISKNEETRDRPGSRKWPPSEGGEGERKEERKTVETSTGELFCTFKYAKVDRPFLFLPWLTSSGPGRALEGGRAPRSSKDTQDRVTQWGSCCDTVWLMPSVLAISWNSSDVISKKKWSEVISIIFILIFLFFRESIWILLLSSPRMLWFTC